MSATAAPTTGRSRSEAPRSTSRCRCYRPTPRGWRAWLERARRAHEELAGVEVIWRQDCYQLPTGRTSFGFKDGIGQPAVEGSGIPGTNPDERPIKAGEFILGYPDETGSVGPMPTPEVLGRNGTYLVFRKLHTRVAAYRQYLRAKAASREEEALLGAKMVGRWQSGAPLALCPEQDDPASRRGSRPEQPLRLRRRSARIQMPRRRACPAREPPRRARSRDERRTSACTACSGAARATARCSPTASWRTTALTAASSSSSSGAHPKRQFEFVKTQWLNDGIFIGAPGEKDPLAGANDGTGTFTIPQRPIRRRLQSLPPFVITRGGEYCFAPGLRALRWLAELDTRIG